VLEVFVGEEVDREQALVGAREGDRLVGDFDDALQPRGFDFRGDRAPYVA
jgi:hypothetical protein